MLRLILLILLLPSLSAAATINVQLKYDIDQTGGIPGPYAATADRSWVTFDSDGPGPLLAAPHLNTVVVKADGVQVGSVVDNPSNRTLPYISVTTPNPRPKITMFTVWLQRPWLPDTAYGLGDKISVFRRPLINGGPDKLPGIPNNNGWWECTRAGQSGISEPDWPVAIRLTSAYRHFLGGQLTAVVGDVIDNGNGATVNLPTFTSTGLVTGDVVTVTGTANYNGTYTLPAQTNGDADHIEITHAYVAETISLGSGASVYLTAAAVVDNGDGTVTLPVPAHGFVQGDEVTISLTTKYDGTYTLPAQTNGDADHLVITASYAAEVFVSGQTVYPTQGNVIDNGNGTTVNLPSPAHGLIPGDVIDVDGTINYNGTYTLPAQTNGDADHIEITHAYVPEALEGGAAAQKKVQDPDSAGVEWQHKTGNAIAAESTPTGRIIIKDNGTGVAVRSGINFIIRYK